MVKIQDLQNFLLNEPTQISRSYLIFSLVLAALLSYILSKLYVKYGLALSNRRRFSDNFILLTMITTLIITVVKSSLALSLGLVGALSIVRFRSAIKEPEELIFLFLCISIGLGLGANQWKITLLSFLIISLFVWMRHFYYEKETDQNLYITVSGKISGSLTLKNIIDILKKNCLSVHLKRFDESKEDFLEASFLVDFRSFNELEKVKKELNALSKSIDITYIDKIGIY